MLMILSLVVPLFLAAAIPTAGLLAPDARDRVRRVMAIAAPGAVVPAIVTALSAPSDPVEIPWFLLGVVLAVDDVGRGLLLIGALLYGAALMSISWAKLRDTERASGALSAFLLASYTGNIGVYLAADVVSFYLCFTLMSFSAAGLVVHYRTQQAYRATVIYLIMSVISETSLLAGLLFTLNAGGRLLADAPDAVLTSDHTGLILTLLLIGFGIKFGTVPLHVWLPLAHPAAPPAASAVLSGAMVKAGMVGFLRFFPLQTEHSELADAAAVLELFGWILLALSLLGAFAAVFIGLVQFDAKVVLAYSTISQMGFIGALIAVGLLNPDLAADTVDAAVLYAVHHGLAKGALFLGVPVIKDYGRGLSGMIVTIGMVGAGLAVAGAPLTSGGLGKYVSKDAIEGLTIAGIGLEYILALVATGSTVLLLRFTWIVLSEDRPGDRRLDGELIAWLAVCLLGIVVPWLVGAYWSPLGLPAWTDAQTLWDATWPIGLGLVLGGLIWWLDHRVWLPKLRRDTPGTAVPAGDLVVAEERLADRLLTRGGAVLDGVHEQTTDLRTRCGQLAKTMAHMIRTVSHRLDEGLRPWPRFGSSIAVLLAITLILSLWFSGGA